MRLQHLTFLCTLSFTLLSTGCSLSLNRGLPPAPSSLSSVNDAVPLARLMPDQLRASVEIGFGMGNNHQVARTPDDVVALGGVPFGAVGSSAQYEPNVYLTLFLGRTFLDRGDGNNNFCAGAIAQV